MWGLSAWDLWDYTPPDWKRHPLRHRRRSKPVTYRVRLDLVGAKPPIWRRLELASDMYLPEVHTVIQAAMGWYGYHLHAFSAGARQYSREAVRFVPEADFEEEADSTDEADVRLDEVLHEAGDRLWYLYDFGDDWEHVLKLEAVAPRTDGDPRAVCIGGRRAGPPEDCGGVWAWQELVAYAADPADAPEWIREVLAELGDQALKADLFDRDEVNAGLAEAYGEP